MTFPLTVTIFVCVCVFYVSLFLLLLRQYFYFVIFLYPGNLGELDLVSCILKISFIKIILKEPTQKVGSFPKRHMTHESAF